MADFRVLIPAAGRGSRAGLAYPKTLYPVHGVPILHRLLTRLSPYDPLPAVVVSPDGASTIRDSLSTHALHAHLVVQDRPRGMGDAVLRFCDATTDPQPEHILMAWGDIPFLQRQTIRGLTDAHLSGQNDFTFVTRFVDSPYTVVSRSASGHVLRVIETREQNFVKTEYGERDIGLFAFRRKLVLDLLQENLAGRISPTTGEHGFLYCIEHLVTRHARVEALPIAMEADLISLNSLDDIS